MVSGRSTWQAGWDRGGVWDWSWFDFPHFARRIPSVWGRPQQLYGVRLAGSSILMTTFDEDIPGIQRLVARSEPFRAGGRTASAAIVDR